MMDFETLDSKIAEGIMKIVPTKFKRMLQVFEESQEDKMLTMRTGRQFENPGVRIHSSRSTNPGPSDESLPIAQHRVVRTTI